MAKQKIPYHPKAKIICACGNIITTGSTLPEMHVEICAKCHPFYTGKQKLIDTGGRIEKFKKRLAKKEEMEKMGKKKNEEKKSR